jgi:PTH1 family peptidyl-tRNA hydrolase
MKLIVGLGNPGNKYKDTRHNLGFMAVDILAEKLGFVWRENKRLKSLVVKSDDLVLLKPQTFMNLSGQAVAAALSYYKITPSPSEGTGWDEVLTVIHDDLDVDYGKIKITAGSRSAGHNGVQSIIDRLGTNDFTRYRIGIRDEKTDHLPSRLDSPSSVRRAENFVLSEFDKTELRTMKIVLEDLTNKMITKNRE